MENFEIINQDKKEDKFEINPETGKLVSHGHEYENTPRMRNFIIRANEIRSSLSSVPEGFSRLWRANRLGEVGKNPSYTNSLEGIALPFSEGYGGIISYVDVPDIDLVKYVRNGVVAEGAEFVLPVNITQQAKIIEGTDLEETTDVPSDLQKKKSSFNDPV